jgi:hypothetical protein
VVADYKSITISFFSLFLTITLGTILLISKDIFLNSEIAKIVSEKNFMNTLKNFVNTLKNFVDTVKRKILSDFVEILFDFIEILFDFIRTKSNIILRVCNCLLVGVQKNEPILNCIDSSLIKIKVCNENFISYQVERTYFSYKILLLADQKDLLLIYSHLYRKKGRKSRLILLLFVH